MDLHDLANTLFDLQQQVMYTGADVADALNNVALALAALAVGPEHVRQPDYLAELKKRLGV